MKRYILKWKSQDPVKQNTICLTHDGKSNFTIFTPEILTTY